MMRVIAALVLLVAAGLFAAWLVTKPAVVTAAALPPHTAGLANGKIMFNVGGCATCHATPDQEDRTKLGGGMALKSPYGTFYPPNISSDPNDGIGGWSEADFVTALWKGTSPDGSHYYPAFPYTSYQHMKLDDVRDLFAYLKTLPPMQGRVRDHDMPFPFNIRLLVGGWKLLYLNGEPFQPDPSRSAQWNRGAYLINGPGHCAECHSPRNVLGAIIEGQRFAGGPNLEGEGWVPNITPTGIGDFSAKDLETLLEFGDLPDGDSVGGAMVAVVRNTSQLPASDRSAMAVYLKSLPPVEGPKPPEKGSPAAK
jgi:mono/diheme cytochrome c family protein